MLFKPNNEARRKTRQGNTIQRPSKLDPNHVAGFGAFSRWEAERGDVPGVTGMQRDAAKHRLSLPTPP